MNNYEMAAALNVGAAHNLILSGKPFEEEVVDSEQMADRLERQLDIDETE
jgi:hypothetical protein